MNFTFDRKIICPQDHTATSKRLVQYDSYYSVKNAICYLCAPKVIVEIGVRAGYSMWSFLQAVPTAVAYGFDIGGEKVGYGDGVSFSNWAKELLKEYDFHYTEVDTQSVDTLALETLAEFIHIDGDHSAAEVKHDMTLAFKALCVKGYMLLDDYYYVKSVRQGYLEFSEEYGSKCEAVSFDSFRGELLLRKLVK